RRDLRDRHPQDGAVVPGSRRLGGRGAKWRLPGLAAHAVSRGPMRLLLLGAHGQVGWELQRSLAPLGELIALDRDTPEAADFARPDTLAALVERTAPDVIVNAAAHTAV